MLNVARLQVLRFNGSYLHTTSVCATRSWRKEQGLPVNKTSEGPLTDLPDFTYLDGRPTPLLHKQKVRHLKQKELAQMIIQLNSEVDFAVERDAKLKEDAKRKREQYINNMLKPKGEKLKK